MMEEFEQKQQEKNEKKEAGQKTAHVAGKAFAGYVGGSAGAKIYDAASKTSLGQALEKNVGNKIARTPGLGNTNKRLNDTGLVDGADKALDLASGNKLGGSNKTLGSNTKKNLANQGRKNSKLASNKSNENSNIPRALQNRGNNQNILNKLQNGYSSSIDEEENPDEVEDNYQDESTNKRDILESKKNLLLMKKLLPVLLPVAIIIFVVFFVVILLSNPIATVVSFFSFEYQNTDKESHYFNETDPERLAEEKAYNARLIEIIDEYQEKYSVGLDKYLLHSIVVYKYFAGSDSEEENTNYINYKKGVNTIDEVANLMVIENGDGTYTTDSKEDGLVYAKLVDSYFLKSYYKSYLKDDSPETRERLVDEIYYFMEYAKELLFGSNNNSFLSDTLPVYLQTCDVPYRKKTNERGNLVFNNRNVNAGTSYPEYLSMTDYLKGVVLAELGAEYINETYREGIKAFVIVATNYALGSFYVDFYPGVESIAIPSGNCRQVSCDPNYGCSYNKEEYSTTFTGVDRYETQSPGWKKPLNQTQQDFLNSVLGEVFGEVMVKKGITSSTFTSGDDLTGASHYDSKTTPGCGSRCLGQKDAMQDAKNGMTYTEILDKYYNSNSYDIINIQEGLYLDIDESILITGNYNGTVNSLKENYHYNQKDSPWGNQKLCGSGNIDENGCNITTIATAISLLKNQRITPEILNNRQNDIKYCRPGKRSEMIVEFANLYGLTATEVRKSNTNAVLDMLEKLATGNYVAIVNLAPNEGRYWTRVGHFVTAVGVKTENGKIKLLIWDPYSTSSHRDNYWADLEDDIFKYLTKEYSFILVGRN